MKKSLLVMSLAVAAFTAQAETVAFVVDGSQSLYTGSGKVVVLPIGFNGTTMPMSADGFSITWEKTKSNEAYAISGSFRWYNDNIGTITPAAGATVTKVTVRCQTTSYNSLLPGFTYDANDALLQSYAGNITEAISLTPTAQVRCSWIEVEYNGTPAVGVPEVGPDQYLLAADQKVTINGNGAKVYYTVDGSTPTAETGKLYTEPFALESSATVRAIAVNDGGASSFEVAKGFVSVPAATTIGAYNFMDISTLNPTYTEDDFVKSGTNFEIQVKDVTFKSGETSIYTGTTGSSATRLYKSMTFGGLVQLRMYKMSTLTFSVPEDKYIAAVVNVGSVNNGQELPEGQTGTLTTLDVYKSGTSATNMWTPAEGEKLNSVVIKENDTAETQYSEHIYVVYADKNQSGNDAIEVDNSNAPVEYFNLQGMRVNGDNLSTGIYVKRQGAKATKIYVK